MVAHIVLLRPRRDLLPESRRELLITLDTARRKIPGITRMRIGRRITLGREYNRTAPEDFTHFLLVEFENVESLQAYLAHPAHQSLGERFGDSLEAAAVFDYELWDIEDLPDL